MITIRYFTWDNTRFPDPVSMQNKLSAKGRKLVNVVDPHMKKDSFPLYDEARDAGLLVVDKNDKVYEGYCWPGNETAADCVVVRKGLITDWLSLYL